MTPIEKAVPRPTARILGGIAVAVAVAMTTPPACAEEMFALTVRPGDTLIGISQRYLDRVGRWPALKTLNRIGDELRLLPGSTLRIPAAWMRWSKGAAEVVHAYGNPTGERGPLSAGMRLEEGASFTTGEGTLTLRFRDGATVAFPPGTHARLGVLKEIRGTPLDDTAIEMDTGAAESRVPSLRSSGSRYEIHTPRVVTAVRGTHFRVAAEGEASRHELIEGGLQLTGAAGAAKLAPGQGLRADGGRLGAAVALPPAPDIAALPKVVTRTVARLQLPPPAAATAATRWHWQVAGDADFLRLLKDERTATPEWVLAGLPDGDYFLRVRTANEQGIEGFDAVRPFALRARPEPPVMLGPDDEARLAGAPVLRWTLNAETAHIHLQVARDAAFADLLLDRQDLTGAQYAFAAALPPGDYHWRLASLRADGYAGPLGDPAVFHQIEPTAIATPELTDGQVKLAWSGPADLPYALQLAADAGFAAPLRNEEVTGNRHVISGLSGGTYFVRTRPVLPGDAAPWSAAQSFEVPADTPWWLLLLLLPLL